MPCGDVADAADAPRALGVALLDDEGGRHVEDHRRPVAALLATADDGGVGILLSTLGVNRAAEELNQAAAG